MGASEETSHPTGSINRRTFLGGVVGVAGIAALAPRNGTALAAIDPTQTDDSPEIAPRIRLALGGETKYRIYLGDKEDVVVRQAATELASYLKSITSATFPIVVANKPYDYDHLLVVGRNNPLTAQAGQGIKYDSLGDDGFALRTTGQSVLIAGAESRGTLYGVYWLLDRLLGVRWYAADYTYTPQTADLDVPTASLNGDHVPRFRFREMYSGDANDPAYRQHNLLNGARGMYEKVPTPASIDTWSTNWTASPFGGTFYTMVPDQTLRYWGQLRCMDPRTREMAAKNLIDVINQRIADGKDPSYGFEQQDTGWTPDPDSKAFADAHGGALSAPIIDMVNDVAARVREKIPEARLSTQAYQFSFEPPTGIRPSDDVVMTVAPVQANFAHSLFADDNKDIGTTIAAWCHISKNVLLWDYLTDFYSYIQPFPSWWATGKGIQALAKHPSAQGYFGEAAYTSPGADFGTLRVWVISRLLWDPTLDTDALIREFLQGYYGPASDPIYSYMKLMVRSVNETSTKLGIFPTIPTSGDAYLNFDTMRQADALLEQAEAAVRANAALLKHVRTVRLGVDYIILLRTTEYQNTARQEGIDWDPDSANRLQRFQAEIEASGLTAANEGGTTPDELIYLVRVATSPGLIQAESLLPPVDSSGKEYKVVATSVGSLVFYRASVPSDFITFGVTVEETGTYHVRIFLFQSYLYGKVQVYLDGSAIGPVFDGYAPVVRPAEPLDLGEHELSKGEHRIKIEVVGKNDSSPNMYFGVDAIQLARTT